MRFDFATADRIVFGAGSSAELGKLARGLGRHALVVTGEDPRRAAPSVSLLSAERIQITSFAIPREPTVDLVVKGATLARDRGCDLVVAIGGGSVLDAGKALAALLTNPGHPLDYMEVIGEGQPVSRDPAPCIAMPTTAGTGAEVTRNAVICSPQHGVKASMRSAKMLPAIALVDPELTAGMPPAITASTGLDALTQLIEAFVSCRANPMTDALCRDGIPRAARALPRAFEDGADGGAREDMALASLYGGLALANAKLGVVHGFAAPVGGQFDAPHGIICGRLLPFAIEANTRAHQDRAPQDPALDKLHEVAQLVTGQPRANAGDGVRWIQTLCNELGLPPLSTFGITQADYPALVEKAMNSSSIKGNPVALTPEELTAVLSGACES